METLGSLVWLAFYFAPPSCHQDDVYRFPDLKTCERAIEFNNACWQFVIELDRKAQGVDTKLWVLKKQIEEASEPWKTLHAAHLAHKEKDIKKVVECLELLRKEIGQQAYDRSVLECPMPLHYFRER